jgi:hypothetical protein
MSWADDLKKITEKNADKMDLFARKFKFDLFSLVVKETRVDQGRLRGNWQISEGTAASGEIDRQSSQAAGVIPSDQLAEIQKCATPDGLTYFVNNLPYAVVYEEKDGMVQRSVEAMKANVKQLADSLK